MTDADYTPPSIEEIRERRAAREAAERAQVEIWAESRRSGSLKPTRTRTVGPVTRQRLSDAVTRHYAQQPTDSKLRAARHARRWSREELGALANVSAASIRDAEQRRPHAVGDLTWTRLATALNLPVEEIKPDAL